MKVPKKLSIANLPTPLQKVEFDDCAFLMKRDDYTGMELSGNKIRKLDYLLYDAVKRKADYIFTCGGDQSNHARATAIAAKQLGIKSKLFLWGKEKKMPDGNLFLDEVFGVDIVYLSKKDYDNVNLIMASEADHLRKKGKNVMVLPTGGSTALGIWGYINFINELKQQLDIKGVKGILSAHGSGGTTAGLVLGLALNGINAKVYGVNVVESKKVSEEIVRRLIEECISGYKLNVKVENNAFEILDGYSREGYKNISKSKIKLIKKFAGETGILLDPAYTGKAFFAYHKNFLMGKKKSNVLFLHTGGIFGVFSKRKEFLN